MIDEDDFLKSWYICPQCMTNVPRRGSENDVKCKMDCGRYLNPDNHMASPVAERDTSLYQDGSIE